MTTFVQLVSVMIIVLGMSLFVYLIGYFIWLAMYRQKLEKLAGKLIAELPKSKCLSINAVAEMGYEMPDCEYAIYILNKRGFLVREVSFAQDVADAPFWILTP